MSRSPGPLPEDTARVTADLGVEAPYHPHLKNAAIGLIGADKSLEGQLEKIRARKEAAGLQSQMPHKPPSKSAPSTPQGIPEVAVPKSIQAPPTYAAGVADAEQLPSHASRKSRKATEVEVPDSEEKNPSSPGSQWSLT